MRKFLLSLVALSFLSLSFNVLADNKIRLVAGAAYIKEGDTLSITNPTMYTGILVQYDKDYEEILAIDLIDGTSTSWFAEKFTEPKHWLNIVTQTKALFTGDFRELAELENWGTIGNFLAQVKAFFIWDIPELERLQSNTTTVKLSEYAYSADYHIGGWVSLILDSAKILLSVVPDDKVKKEVKKDVAFKALKITFTNQNLIADIRGLLAENRVKDAVSKAMVEFGKVILIEIGKVIIEVGIEEVKADIIDELKIEYGIEVTDRLNLVGNTLDGLQLVANGLDAASMSINYYFGDGLDAKASHITLKENADFLELRKMETLKTGEWWFWHSPVRGLAFILTPKSERYQSGSGHTCRDYRVEIYSVEDGHSTSSDGVSCLQNGVWIKEEDLFNEPLTITTTELPDAVVGEPYFVQLNATGGVPPYEWQLTLSPWLDGYWPYSLQPFIPTFDFTKGILYSNKVIECKGTGSWYVEVEDARGQIVEESFNLVVTGNDREVCRGFGSY